MEIPQRCNVLVTGTPGTGKTSLCAMLQDQLGLKHIEVGKLVKDEHFYTEFDAAFDSYIVEEEDEDRLLDYLEPIVVRGGCAVDYHSCEMFPKRWFGCVVVVRADTDKVFDRLTARGYSEAKREENIDAEIADVCELEARRSYDKSIIEVRQSNSLGDLLETVEVVRRYVSKWTPKLQEQYMAAVPDPEEDDGEDGHSEGCGGSCDGHGHGQQRRQRDTEAADDDGRHQQSGFSDVNRKGGAPGGNGNNERYD